MKSDVISCAQYCLYVYSFYQSTVIPTCSIKCKDSSRIAKTAHKTSMYSERWCPHLTDALLNEDVSLQSCLSLRTSEDVRWRQWQSLVNCAQN
jgi:hypothetical protein